MAYRDILEEIRLAFPQPVSDTIHDSYFVHSIMHALDQVDGLKTHLPMLGDIVPLGSREYFDQLGRTNLRNADRPTQRRTPVPP